MRIAHSRINSIHRSGFTFLEIILVVTIIGILASIVVPRLVGRSTQAKVMATRAQMSTVKTALIIFEMDLARFPTSSEGLLALVNRPSSVPDADYRDGGYVDNLPKDAWGEPFIYKHPSNHGLKDFDLTSKGQDRQEGTEDDINNWDGIDTGSR